MNTRKWIETIGIAWILAANWTPAQAQPGSSPSDSLRVILGGGANNPVDTRQTLTEAQEALGLFLTQNVPAKAIFYLESDGSTSDIVSFAPFKVTLVSDVNPGQPVLPPGFAPLDPASDVILTATKEFADVALTFGSDVNPGPLESDTLALVADLLSGPVVTPAFPAGFPPNPLSIPEATETAGVVPVALPRIVINMLEPGGLDSDLLIISDPTGRIGVTVDVTSDVNLGMPLPAPGPNDIVCPNESCDVFSVIAASDVPEPSSLALLSVCLLGLGAVLRRRRLGN